MKTKLQQIFEAGGIAKIAKRAGVPAISVTAFIRGELADDRIRELIESALDAAATITKTTSNTIISREEARGKRAWS